MIVRRSALVDRSAEQLFDLIEAAEFYPQFVPWCVGATILCRSEAEVSADIRVQWHGAHFTLRTRNPKQRPQHMHILLTQGPFRHFAGEWRLTALQAGACKVDFSLDCEFDSVLLTQLAGPVLGGVATALVDAFVQRALDAPA